MGHAHQYSRTWARGVVILLMGSSVYILRCANGSYYVGITDRDVETRFSEHQQGLHDGYTARNRPLELVHSEYFETIKDAIVCERRLKGWSRAKKEAWIAGRFDLLPGLSRRGGARD